MTKPVAATYEYEKSISAVSNPIAMKVSICNM